MCCFLLILLVITDNDFRHFMKFDPLKDPFWSNYIYDISWDHQICWLLKRVYLRVILLHIDSIMHFKSFAWAINESIPTIRSIKSKNEIIGSVDGLLSSVLFIKIHINFLKSYWINMYVHFNIRKLVLKLNSFVKITKCS